MGLINKVLNHFHKEQLPLIHQVTEDYGYRIEQAERDTVGDNLIKSLTKNKALADAQSEELSKSYHNKETAYSVPVGLVGYANVGEPYRQKNGDANFSDISLVLRQLSKEIVVSSILNVRGNQVASYCDPAHLRDDGVGYALVRKDGKKNNDVDTKNIADIEDFLHNTGNKLNPEYNLRTWAKETVRDILVYDQANTELVYDKGPGSNLIKFIARDPATIFRAVDKETGEEIKGKNPIKYVQKVEDKYVYFHGDELSFNCMNPRTDIYAGRYGLSPLQTAMDNVNYILTTEKFNATYFSQGGTTMGILHIKSGDQQTAVAMENFRRDWEGMFHGPQGAHRIPVISADTVEYINMNQSSKDMEFEKWINYNIYVICGDFGIDSSEINIPNRGGATGSKGNSLQESSRKEQSSLSKARGLDPLLHFIEDIVNSNIMPHLKGGKYLFKFVGDSIEREQQVLDLEGKKVANFMTFNELRKQHGLDPIEGGDAIANQFFINSLGQVQALKAQQQQNQQETDTEANNDNSDNDNPDKTPDDKKGLGDFQENQKLASGKLGTDKNPVMKNGLPRK